MTKETPYNIHTFKNFISIYNKKEMSKRLTTEVFIKNSINIHGEKYDYSMVQYIDNHTKVKIICPIHGQFEQLPNDHTSKKCGCYKCGGHGTTTKEFISKCIKIHGKKYDYSKTIFNGVDNIIVVSCKKHGEFNQVAYTHSNGAGCKKCRSEKMSIIQRLSKNEFIKKSNLIHNKKFDYSESNYTIGKEKVCIICPNHGRFMQQAQAHLQGKGCPTCKESVGERNIRIELDNRNIRYESQKRFPDCINHESKRKLPFDFYLPEKNIAIEFNGKQHYGIKHGYFGAKPAVAIEKHNRLIQNDAIKKSYCERNNIQLIIIDDIKSISKFIKKYVL